MGSDIELSGVLSGIAAACRASRTVAPDMWSTSPWSPPMASGRRRVWNISQALRQEHSAIRTTTISPGVEESELAATITDPDTAAYLHEACKIALKPGGHRQGNPLRHPTTR